MKCPNCGEEVLQDHLYCDHCGEEIRIVPDFEPEIENSITETLSGLAEEINPSLGNNVDALQEEIVDMDPFWEEKPFIPNFSKKRQMTLVGGVLLVLFLLFFLSIIIVDTYRNNSSVYLSEKAEAAFQQQDYAEAINAYERILEIDPDNITSRLNIADVYKVTDNGIKAETQYLEVLKQDPSSLDAYKGLISLYEKEKEYEKINELLLVCSNHDALELFGDYLAKPPEFSVVEGTYNQVVPLKLMDNKNGTIYYTVDGSEPTEKSNVFKTPIFLEKGNYTVKAFFVNKYGVKSSLVKSEYQIDLTVPLSPEISKYSGTYTQPTLIEATIPENCTVYYTTDETEPTNRSIPYTGPIPMMLGDSVFKFVSYSNEGVAGEVITRNYSLNIKVSLTVEEATGKLTAALIKAGMISDATGKIPNLGGVYLYEYDHVFSKGNQTFYFFREVYNDGLSKNNTGTYYVVDVMTGDCYQAIADADGNYTVQTF